MVKAFILPACYQLDWLDYVLEVNLEGVIVFIPAFSERVANVLLEEWGIT